MNHPFKISRVSGPPVSGAQVAASAPPHSAEAATLPDDGYGRQARCITCRKGMSNCLCDAPDIDVPSVEDMRRIMGWELAERSAFGMTKPNQHTGGII